MSTDTADALRALTDPLLGPGSKGFPARHAPVRASRVGTLGWNVADGDLPLPLALIRRDALAHNLGWMQRFAAERGLVLAPHGKTTMSPQLFTRQLEAGAWGMTVATATQAVVAAAAGAERILVANQVLDTGDLRTLAALRTPKGQAPRVLSLLDSPAQLAAIESAWATLDDTATPFDVLLEVGVACGRTGCRSEDDALALARAARDSAAVRLVGVECYEGLTASGDDAIDAARVGGFTQLLETVARVCAEERLFETDEVLLSAGGSGVFDFVVQALQATLPRHTVRGVLRSGCYVTHDHGHYCRLVARVNARIGCDGGLRGALEVWARVQSCPEPGLAILAVGKRDVSYDLGLPVPIGWCPGTQRLPQAAPEGWTISSLNDQHAYLRHATDTPGPAVGDRVVLGISHPCTTFDKWRWMPVVDADYRVVDAVVTCF